MPYAAAMLQQAAGVVEGLVAPC